MAFKILVLGGSYAGLAAVTALLDLSHGRRSRYDFTTDPLPSKSHIPLDIVVIDERDGYMHLIGTPLALADRDFTPIAWQRFSEIPGLRTAPGVRFIQGIVQSIDPDTRYATIVKSTPLGATKEILKEKYDYVLVATGLRRLWPTVPSAKTKSSYLAQCNVHLDQVEKAEQGVVVVGGGAVGIEMASELSLIHGPKLSVTLIHSRPRLLSAEPLPDEFANTASQLLAKNGVDLRLNSRVLQTKQISTSPPLFSLTLSSGEVLNASVVIWAISQQRGTGSEFLPPDAVDQEGYVEINANLSIKNMPQGHFCAGDVVQWSGIRRAGTAMWMGSLAANNIYLRMLMDLGELDKEDIKDKELMPIPPMMGLAIGNDAVMYSEADGVKAGEDVRKMLFEDDLGWTICWNYMKLGEDFKP